MKKITILSVLSVLILQLNAQKKTMIPQYEGYKLVFQDEFEKDGTPNKKKWDYEIGFIRNKEPQWYQRENAFCKDGLLNIVAKKEEKANPNYDSTSKDWTKNRAFAHYTSACLISKGKFEFKYGKVVMRGKIDTKKGMWPAFWMLGVNRGPVKWPACGEVDIMEYYHQNLLGNIFWDGGMKDTHIPLRQLGDSSWSDNFHEWVLDWTKDKMSITVDGREVNKFDLTKTINKGMGNNPFNEKMYLLLNLALGQGGENIPSENLPATFLVDYVRIYQQR